MTPPNPFLPLLRWRSVRAELAAVDLGVAHARVRESAALEHRARTALGGITAEPVDLATLRAISAARMAAAAAITDLEAARQLADLALHEAELRHRIAATDRRVAEKLARRVDAACREQEAGVEQRRLDDAAIDAWRRADRAEIDDRTGELS